MRPNRRLNKRSMRKSLRRSNKTGMRIAKMRTRRFPNEVKFTTNTYNWTPQIYQGTAADNNLGVSSSAYPAFARITNFPTVGTTQSQRIGNMIQNVKQVIKLEIKFYRQLTISTVVTPISIISCRIIIWTSTERIFPNDGTDVVSNFWLGNKNVYELGLHYINRSNITVLYDKYHKYMNPQSTAWLESATQNPVNGTIGKLLRINFQRRFKRVVFPADNSTIPKRCSYYTYVSVIQDDIAFGASASSNSMLRVDCTSRTYFQD